MKLRVKRSLYLLHRWFGVGLCALFALWFATGSVLSFVPFPQLEDQARIAAQEEIDVDAVDVTPGSDDIRSSTRA